MSRTEPLSDDEWIALRDRIREERAELKRLEANQETMRRLLHPDRYDTLSVRDEELTGDERREVLEEARLLGNEIEAQREHLNRLTTRYRNETHRGAAQALRRLSANE